MRRVIGAATDVRPVRGFPQTGAGNISPRGRRNNRQHSGARMDRRVVLVAGRPSGLSTKIGAVAIFFPGRRINRQCQTSAPSVASGRPRAHRILPPRAERFLSFPGQRFSLSPRLPPRPEAAGSFLPVVASVLSGPWKGSCCPGKWRRGPKRPASQRGPKGRACLCPVLCCVGVRREQWRAVAPA